MCAYVSLCMSVFPEGRGQPCWLVRLYGCSFCHPRRLSLTANSLFLWFLDIAVLVARDKDQVLPMEVTQTPLEC